MYDQMLHIDYNDLSDAAKKRLSIMDAGLEFIRQNALNARSRETFSDYKNPLFAELTKHANDEEIKAEKLWRDAVELEQWIYQEEKTDDEAIKLISKLMNDSWFNQAGFFYGP